MKYVNYIVRVRIKDVNYRRTMKVIT